MLRAPGRIVTLRPRRLGVFAMVAALSVTTAACATTTKSPEASVANEPEGVSPALSASEGTPSIEPSASLDADLDPSDEPDPDASAIPFVDFIARDPLPKVTSKQLLEIDPSTQL